MRGSTPARGPRTLDGLARLPTVHGIAAGNVSAPTRSDGPGSSGYIAARLASVGRQASQTAGGQGLPGSAGRPVAPEYIGLSPSSLQITVATALLSWPWALMCPLTPGARAKPKFKGVARRRGVTRPNSPLDRAPT